MSYLKQVSHSIRLDEDWHVHSTFSDGTSTVEQNVHAAEARELTRLCLFDHVNRSSGWVREFSATCRAVSLDTPVQVSCGVEAKLLDTHGSLDLPASAERADYIFAADRQLPTPDGPMHPDEARERIESGRLPAVQAIEWLVRASANAARRHERLILAHPFSILPKLGLGERNLPAPFVHWLASVMAERGAATEVSERWRCPAPWVAVAFARAGVTVHASTDSHSPEAVGEYEWCREVAAEVAAHDTYSTPILTLA